MMMMTTKSVNSQTQAVRRMQKSGGKGSPSCCSEKRHEVAESCFNVLKTKTDVQHTSRLSLRLTEYFDQKNKPVNGLTSTETQSLLVFTNALKFLISLHPSMQIPEERLIIRYNLPSNVLISSYKILLPSVPKCDYKEET